MTRTIKARTARALYKRIGKRYSQNRPLAISDYTELPTVIKLAGNVKGKRVLDAGCGPGRHSKKLLARGAHVTGIDISREMVETAAKHCNGRGEFFQADFLKADLQSETFDLIIASLTLMYSRKLTPIFANFSRWLKPGGRLLFSLYHPIRFFQKIPHFDFSRSQKVWIPLGGCDVTVFNYYHPLQKYFEAAISNDLDIVNFMEPVLNKRRSGWPEDMYRIPRALIVEACKRRR